MSQKTIIALVIVVLGTLIPAYFLLSHTPTPDYSTVVSASVPTTDAEAMFVNLSSQLVPLAFDTSILNDPRFTSLIDLHTVILPEASGRRDPFAAF